MRVAVFRLLLLGTLAVVCGLPLTASVPPPAR
jgi:hypothetical protein